MEKERICPLLNKPCLKEKCQWWVPIFEEGSDCAINMIAMGLENIHVMLDLLNRK